MYLVLFSGEIRFILMAMTWVITYFIFKYRSKIRNTLLINEYVIYKTAIGSYPCRKRNTQRTFFEDMSTFFLHDILRALQILLTVRLSGYV